MYVAANQVKDVLRAGAPEFKGREAEIKVSKTVRLANTQWSGGCVDIYTFVRLADLAVMPTPKQPFMENSPLHETDLPIPEGFLVVIYKKRGTAADLVTILTPVENMLAALPAPAVVSEDERIVLLATRTLKSSYAGIKNYRFSEANRKFGITLDRWEAAKTALIGRKLLNAAGAITPDGRNIVAGDHSF
jgi:hypothetical protein